MNGSTDSSNRWMISPVCSRFRDHLQMYNGGVNNINDSLQKMKRADNGCVGDNLAGFTHSPIVGGRSILLDAQNQVPSSTNGPSLWPLTSPPDQSTTHRYMLGATTPMLDDKSTSKGVKAAQHSTYLLFSKNHC
jgi:hypothetical protein